MKNIYNLSVVKNMNKLSLSPLAASPCRTKLCNPVTFPNPVNHLFVSKKLLQRTSTLTRSLSTKFLKQLFGLFTNNRRIITCSLFLLIHTNRRVSICSVILQRELLNLEILSVRTVTVFRDLCNFISSLFF